MNDNPSIEQQIQDLKDAGWKAMTRTIWRSPLGKLFLGPHGAWKAAQNQGSRETHKPHRYSDMQRCDLCGKLGAAYVKTPARFWKLCHSCAGLIEDAGLTEPCEVVRPMGKQNS